MTTIVAVAALLILVASGVHIALALGIIAVGLLNFNYSIPVVLIAQMAWDSIDKYALVCIPFFIFAGNLMSRGNLALVILELVGTVIRWFRGGIALALAISSVFFAAVNGSSVACAVALGPAAVKLLPAEGYSTRFAASVVAVCGTLGLMIPPSLTFILIGSIVGLPITDLFIAGIVPGLFEAALLGVTTLVVSRINGYGGIGHRPDWKGFGQKLPGAAGALLMPVLIIGTIYMGWFTPTEVSALAAAYAMVLVLLVYRTANLAAVWDTARESVMQTVMIYGVLLGSGLLTAVLTRLGIAAELTGMLTAAQVSPFEFLLVVNLCLIVIGMFLDGVSMIVLLAPILFPMASAVGVNPIHFAVIMTALVEVATLTPPVGLNLFVMSRITKLPLHEMVRGVLPFYGARLLALVILNAFPALSLALL
ncbi:TRAP transporter large permease [Azospirillum sp. RWY-5-1]|uniref:TRAP transporter large permease protein n=1 Tax=Azospirillum oleiclasticum TaxID=2735135 RepID=A0ABX2THH8_9PROT|nr:TRAP transporter large permease [Azospirillum oleiclasticum]NYZ16229.1 TRAP transporter large permease [Azospirillum oleiclasticum]NYZ23716.1 TRAP transporter large permease [Azospirillum oleiclasticum]